MVENKISLTFVLPGSILLSEQECSKNPKNSYITHKIMLPHSIKGKKMKPVYKPIFVKTRKTRTVTQHINMTTEAYLYMLNTPTTSKLSRMVKNKSKGIVRAWDLLSEHEKLSAHFDLIASDLHAISYFYEILQD